MDLTERRAYVIIVKVFDGGDGEDTDERHGRGDGRQRRDGRYELEHKKTGEVEIGQPVKLLEQIQRQERHQRVFRRLDVIVLSNHPVHPVSNPKIIQPVGQPTSPALQPRGGEPEC